MSFSITASTSFTRTHARKVATKMAADLRRMGHTYGWPTESVIESLLDEVTELLANGYIDSLEVGFARHGQRVVSLKYYARTDGTLTTDDNAGGIPRGADVDGCEHVNFVTYSAKWSGLSPSEREQFPYQRTTGDPPADGLGYWTHDRTYSAGGGGTIRKSFRPW